MRPWERPWWPWAKRIFAVGFAVVVLALLTRYARHIDWHKVKTTLEDLPRAVLLQALGLAALSHFVYSLMDLVGRHYTGHDLPRHRVMQVSFISYAFNLNLGSLVGGIGFRYRMYAQQGVRYGNITRIVTLSMMTNWLGYILLAGLVFTIAPMELPPSWNLDREELRLLGVVLLAVSVCYLILCAFARQRSYTIRGHEIEIPTLRMALAQLGISCSHWTTMAAVPWCLLHGQVDYPTALSVLLTASMAGVLMHVPAGLGVMEAVYVALLSHRIPRHELIGVLLAFRAVFYLAPLLVGALMYLTVEMRSRKEAAAA
jgi:uncharacterized membrane protein YbhN (UPF0104 family)